MKKFFQEFANSFLSLVYPQACLTCNDVLVKGEEIFCTNCLLDFPFTAYENWQKNALYDQLSLRMPNLSGANSLFYFRKKSKVQKILHACKYNNQPEIANRLGVLMYTHWQMQLIEMKIDMIIPVPLHVSRQRQRGYNQSEELAKGFESSGINLTCGNLVRIRKTKTQTKQNRFSRWLNMQTVFALREPDAIKGKIILLLDDVITTGATIEACYEVLKEGGATKIFVAGLARA